MCFYDANIVTDLRCFLHFEPYPFGQLTEIFDGDGVYVQILFIIIAAAFSVLR